MTFLRTIALPTVLLAALPAARADIAFVRSNRLYVFKLDAKGRPAEGSPRMICRLWPIGTDTNGQHPDWLDLAWSPDGKRLLINHVVDTTNTGSRLGIPEGMVVGGIYVVEARPGGRLRKVVSGANGVMSPDGKTLAYQRTTSEDLWDRLHNEVWVKDLKTGAQRRFAGPASWPLWRPDGMALAIIECLKDYSQPVTIRAFPGGKTIKTFGPAVSPCQLHFSPDGGQIAIHFSLSRPLTGHSVWSMNDGPFWEVNQVGDYAPVIIDDWTKHGRVVEWRVQTQDNDGCWDSQLLVLERQGRRNVRIGMGSNPMVSGNGRFVAYLTDFRSGDDFTKPMTLLTQALKGKRTRAVLATRVLTYALYR